MNRETDRLTSKPTVDQLNTLAEIGWQRKKDRILYSTSSLLSVERRQEEADKVYGGAYHFADGLKVAAHEGESERSRNVRLSLSRVAFDGTWWFECRDTTFLRQADVAESAQLDSVHQFLWSEARGVQHAHRYDEMTDRLGSTGVVAPLYNIHDNLSVHDDELTLSMLDIHDVFQSVSSADCDALIATVIDHHSLMRSTTQ